MAILTVQLVRLLQIRNLSYFSIQCFGYHISYIVLDVRIAFGFIVTLRLASTHLPWMNSCFLLAYQSLVNVLNTYSLKSFLVTSCVDLLVARDKYWNHANVVFQVHPKDALLIVKVIERGFKQVDARWTSGRKEDVAGDLFPVSPEQVTHI